MVERGTFTMWIDGVERQITQPVLVNIPQDHVHGFHFTHGMGGYVLSISTAELSVICHGDTAVLDRLVHPGVAEPSEDEVSAFRRLSQIYRSTDAARATLLRATGCEIACRTAARLGAAIQERDSSRRGGVLEAFETLLNTHFRDRWRVGDYAERLDVTPAHLSRVCRARAGMSASAWIERRIVTEACRELAYTTKPVSQVAYELGFEDPSHFARVFRRVARTSPTAYRG